MCLNPPHDLPMKEENLCEILNVLAPVWPVVYLRAQSLVHFYS